MRDKVMIPISLTLTQEQGKFLYTKISKSAYIRELIERDMKKGGN